MRVPILAVLVSVVSLAAFAAEDPYSHAETLASQRKFDQAEIEYRRSLAERPGDWRLRLGLARVLLWGGRYAEAERAFTGLVVERPGDGDALLGHAQAAYWRGDFRRARPRYVRLLEARPQDAEARKVLADLELLAATRYEITAVRRDDSQPYRVSTMRAAVSYFSDPLTRWDVFGSAGEVSGGEERSAAVGGGASVTFPRLRASVAARAERFRFPDGEAAWIGSLSVTRGLPWRSALVATAERTPLLWTASSARAHAVATQYTVGWRRDPSERWLAAVNAHALRYSDGNRGSGADAWLVAPVLTREGIVVRAGVSGAWRDTELDRFRFTTFESQQLSPGRWRYTFTGVYDPYWTPHELREGRLVVVAEWPRLKIHADGGVARDRALGFGPRTGPTPTPFFVFPAVTERSFRPWRAGADLTWPLTSRVELRARYRHDVTVFYRANEFEASLGGRL